MSKYYNYQELEDFYNKNADYLKFLYSNEGEFIDAIIEYKENEDADEKFCSLIMDNLRCSQGLYCKNEYRKLNKLYKAHDSCNSLKEIKQIEKDIKIINEKIYKKKTFLKQFFLTLDY